MDVLGMFIGLAAAWQVVVWSLAGVLFPLFWLWMLVDAFMREPWEYPSKSGNEKLVWVLALVFFQFVAPFYLVMVFRRLKRGMSAPAAACAA
ncbi:MAG TPA: PLDc N-terminal domain-containing protein [Coriobacteriia bacterium]